MCLIENCQFFMWKLIMLLHKKWCKHSLCSFYPVSRGISHDFKGWISWPWNLNSTASVCVCGVLSLYLTYGPVLCVSKWDVICVGGLTEKNKKQKQQISIKHPSSSSCFLFMLLSTFGLSFPTLNCLGLSTFWVVSKVSAGNTHTHNAAASNLWMDVT